MLRILIADDHEIVRKGVRELVGRHDGWEVCGEAADGEAALELALRDTPDVAVLDVSLPKIDGLSLTRRLQEERPRIRVLLFTMHDDYQTVRKGLTAGARGYVLKTDREEQLEAAISALGANRPHVSAFASQLLLDFAAAEGKRGQLQSFTPRELQIGQMMAEGESNKHMARQLGISIKTVESHRAAALRKAGVHTAAEFVRFAIRHKLILA